MPAGGSVHGHHLPGELDFAPLWEHWSHSSLEAELLSRPVGPPASPVVAHSMEGGQAGSSSIRFQDRETESQQVNFYESNSEWQEPMTPEPMPFY